jgi:hypothetical protein
MRQFTLSVGWEFYLCLLALAGFVALTAESHPQPELLHVSQVDVIERNTVHDGQGRVTLTQWILWDVERRDKREHVVAWRLVKTGETVSRRDGFYRIAWGERLIQAASYRDRHTQHDPEIDDREYRVNDLRRGKDWYAPQRPE